MSTAKPTLIISETSTSTWNYHLRRVEGGKTYMSGGAPAAVCGRQLGWDTKIPLNAWGTKSHIPQTWCSRCGDEAKRLGVKVGPGE